MLLGFGPRPSHFLLPGQEKVTKEKATPTSGPGYAGVPSFRCRSGGTSRRGVPSPSLLPRRPCLASPCATPPLGLLTGNGVRVVWKIENCFGIFWPDAQTIRRHQPPLSGG